MARAIVLIFSPITPFTDKFCQSQSYRAGNLNTDLPKELDCDEPPSILGVGVDKIAT